MSPTCATSVPIASENGTTNTSTSAIVITRTASQRRRHSRSCTASIIGQVATAIIVAQIIAGRNGVRTHNEDAISSPRIVMTKTDWKSSGVRL